MSAGFLALVQEAKKRIKEVTPQELKEMMQSVPGLLVIDVREREEVVHGGIQDAFHISRGVIEPNIEKLAADKETPIVLYCSGGYRSALAADNLQLMGYSKVYSLAGGYAAWKNIS